MQRIPLFFALILCLSLHAAPSAERNNPAKLAQDIAWGNNLFAFELQEELLDDFDNLVFSPFSVSACLAMCAAGAKGDTFKQMRRVLHLPSTAAEMDLGFKSLLHTLSQEDNESLRPTTLDIAQAIWMQKGAHFLPLFQSRVVNDYMGDLRQADFQEPKQATYEINEWVEQRTRGRIRKLFKPGQITPLTHLVLVSAIYMKAPFLRPFDGTHTRESIFHVNEQKNIHVPLMYQKNYFPYHKGSTFSVIEIPYVPSDQEVVLWIILPNTLDETEATLQQWNLREMERVKNGLETAYVELQLPRFKLTTDISLIPTLKNMGMTIPFSEEADFSLITDDEHLSIDQVVHQAFLQINETGTIAAAATGAAMITKALPPEEAISFVVDRPFSFLIFDKKSDVVLFMGHVSEPTPIRY